MMNSFTRCLGFVAFLIAIFTAIPRIVASEPDVKNIEHALAMYDKAIGEKDVQALERLVVDDYRLVDQDGVVFTKKEFIDQYREPDFTLEVAKSSNNTIRVYGDMAIANGVWTEKGRHKGKAHEYSQRFTTVFVKQNGAWRVASDHVTTIK